MSSFGLCGIAERTRYRRRVSRNQAFRYGIRASVSGVAKIEFPTTESTVCIDISHIYKLILWCIVQDRRTLLKVRLFSPPWKHFVPCKFLSDLRLSAVERQFLSIAFILFFRSSFSFTIESTVACVNSRLARSSS